MRAFCFLHRRRNLWKTLVDVELQEFVPLLVERHRSAGRRGAADAPTAPFSRVASGGNVEGSMGLPPADDDWFSEPDVQPRPTPTAVGRDDWLEPTERAVPPRRAGLRDLGDIRIVILVAIPIVFLVSVLAAFGVFSGGGSPPRVVGTTTTTAPAVTAPPARPTATTTTQPAVRVPATTLKPGDTGSNVTLLQEALVRLGYLAGKADGNYGPATTRAVVAFQRAKGLTADGVVGPATLQALTSALNP